MPYGGNWSWGQVNRRDPHYFTGSTNAYSKFTWNNIDIDQNLRTITPKNRSGANGVGNYNPDTMLNLSSFIDSNGRWVGDRNWLANSGNASISTKQMTTLTATAPNIFWNGQQQNYKNNSNSSFSNQNNGWFYNFWRLGQAGGNVVNDIAQNSKSTQHLLNHATSWDDQLFAISGVEQPNESHGNKFNKVAVSTQYQDFNVSRPLIYQDTGGLPREGGDVYSKAAPVDGAYQSGDQDYYLNYYPKYNSSLTNIPRSKSGYDWAANHLTSGGEGYSAYRGYSAVLMRN